MQTFFKSFFLFIFVLPAFKASLYFSVYLQGEERQQKQGSKQTNKQKNNFCFTGSEAETHDVISDARVRLYFYVEMNV